MDRPDARDVATVTQWCAARDDEPSDVMRLEVEVAPNVIAIVNRRFDEADDEDIARLRYRPAEGVWVLYQVDAHSMAGGWRRFDLAEPSSDLAPLLRVVEDDPTGIFWG